MNIKIKKSSVSFLNMTHFMGVLNDQIFKLVLGFFLIKVLGQDQTNLILSFIGGLFILPFLIFSPIAGSLADKFNKKKLIVLMRSFEIAIMLLSIPAFKYNSIWGSCILLFLLATHSALLSPAKYAIISELVPKTKISNACGLITSFSHIGVICGTFFASFITEKTDYNFSIIAAFCCLIAVLGFISSIAIPSTPPQKTEIKLQLFPNKGFFSTFSFCKTSKYFIAIFIASFSFYLMGAFMQLNLIPYAITELNCKEVVGGYLFFVVALGMAVGAYLSGRTSKKKTALGIACLTGILLPLLLICLGVFCKSLIVIFTTLVLIGICGGLFIIPFDYLTQILSPNHKRGQIIAIVNFLSFSAVLLASVLLFVLHKCQFTSGQSFAFIGILVFFFSIATIIPLSDIALPFFARYCIKPFTRLKVINSDLLKQNPRSCLVLKNGSWKNALLLMSTFPNIHLLIEKKWKKINPSNKETLMQLFCDKLQTLKNTFTEELIPCVYMNTAFHSYFHKFIENQSLQLIYVEITNANRKTIVAFHENP